MKKSSELRKEGYNLNLIIYNNYCEWLAPEITRRAAFVPI